MFRLCMTVNKLFKLPVHPFNLNNEGKKTYAQWQYEKGIDTNRVDEGLNLALSLIKEIFPYSVY